MKGGKELELAEFRRFMLREHNEIRRRHGVEPVTGSAELDAVAQRWADKMAERGKLQHSVQTPERSYQLGENIFWDKTFRGNEEEAKAALSSFYDEISDYSFSNPDKPRTGGKHGNKVVGHFTQVVWRRTYEIGSGIALGKNGEVFVCVNYDPPGNCDGAYADNVFPLGSKLAPKPALAEVPTIVARRHNQLRQRHGAPLLYVNVLLNREAQTYAEQMAVSQDFKYRSGYQYGLNIGIVSEFEPAAAVDVWYKQGENWTADSTLTPEVSNFAQVVWAETRRIGVGLAEGRPWSVLVCIYEPKGCYSRSASDNIKPALPA